MKISLIVEADYTDLQDKDALQREKLEANLRLLAQRVEADYRDHNSQQNKYGVFYQLYTLNVGGQPSRLRKDTAAQAALLQLDLETKDPIVKPAPDQSAN